MMQLSDSPNCAPPLDALHIDANHAISAALPSNPKLILDSTIAYILKYWANTCHTELLPR